MGKQIILNAGLIIILFALQSNVIEYLSGDGYSSAVILLFSSVVMLLISTVVCLQKGLSPLPSNWGVQWLRMLCSGSGLYLGTLSYQYVHATTASLISQLNVPYIVILTAIGSRQADRRLLLSVVVVSIALLFFGLSPYSHESGIGVSLSFVAVLFLAISYLQAKRSVSIENTYVIINVTSLSCICIALISLTITEQRGWHYDLADIGLLISVGLLRFGQNLGLLALMRIYSADQAQFPFLLGTMATMSLEMWLEHHVFPTPYITAIVGLSLIISFIVFRPTSNTIPNVENAIS